MNGETQEFNQLSKKMKGTIINTANTTKLSKCKPEQKRKTLELERACSVTSSSVVNVTLCL